MLQTWKQFLKCVIRPHHYVIRRSREIASVSSAFNACTFLLGCLGMLRYIIIIINEVPTERCRLTAVKYVAQSTKRRSDDNDDRTTTEAHSDATKKSQRCPEENSAMNRGIRHGTDATQTTDNYSKNNFRSKEVFPRPRNLSIYFVPDLTP